MMVYLSWIPNCSLQCELPHLVHDFLSWFLQFVFQESLVFRGCGNTVLAQRMILSAYSQMVVMAEISFRAHEFESRATVCWLWVIQRRFNIVSDNLELDALG